MRTTILRAALAAALLALPSPARADATEDARVLFDAGARAYKAGDFRAAIQAFEQAYKLDARPNLLFSVAQAHRRQYVLDRRPGHVAVAVKYFRDYLARVPSGGRRADAVAALGEMEPLAAKLEQDGQLQPTGVGESATRLVVSSPTDGAVVVLDDDKKERPAPLIAELRPGKHVLRVRAPGFTEERREIDIAPGAVTALDLPLRELPARLAVGGLRGAELRVDGRPLGTVPFAAFVEVAPGKHEIRVAKAGHEDRLETLDLSRGALLTIDARLPLTTQRKVSIGLLGGGGLALAAGAILGAVSLGQQATANGIKSDIDAGKITCRDAACPKLDQYNSAVEARDRLRAGTGALLGGGLAAAAAGALLYLFDDPKLRAGLLTRSDDTPAAPPKLPEVEVSAAPVVGPGFAGAGISVRF
jgi:hypothetical protein